MHHTKITRRAVLKGSAAVAAGTLAPSAKVLAQAPPATTITPELIKAALKEGTCTTTPRSTCRWRSGSRARSSSATTASRCGSSVPAPSACSSASVRNTPARSTRVDVVNSSDAAHLIVWKSQGILAPFVPEDVAKHLPEEHRDPDGMFSSFRVTLCPIAYNTKTVKAEEAPKSFNDLLDPKWASRMTKAHPSYSGTILTATYQVSRDLGWGYFEKLAKQKIMQLQSATDPPKKLVLGERVMADGTEYMMLQEKENGSPLEIVYPAEGTPLIIGPNAVFKAAPNPNAAKLLQSYCYAGMPAAVIDHGGMRSVHAQAKEKPGRMPLARIKL